MYNPTLEHTIKAWSAVADTIIVPHTEAEYERLVAILDELIDVVGEDEEHPQRAFTEMVGVLVEAYENKYVPDLLGDPRSTLQWLMADHALTPDDLPELGNAETVNQILAGKVELTTSQIKLLANRFHVSAATFI